MFGIGLPEMILILALALIVVGPDKLPELARSIAKGVLELKKTVSTLKEEFADENPFDSVKPELEEVAHSLKDQLGEQGPDGWQNPLDGNDLSLSELASAYDTESAADGDAAASATDIDAVEPSADADASEPAAEAGIDTPSKSTDASESAAGNDTNGPSGVGDALEPAPGPDAATSAKTADASDDAADVETRASANDTPEPGATPRVSSAADTPAEPEKTTASERSPEQDRGEALAAAESPGAQDTVQPDTEPGTRRDTPSGPGSS